MPPTEQLAELIDRKHQVLVQLRDVGHRQQNLIAGRDTAALLALLAAKQSLISALQGIERELTPFHDETAEERVWRSAEARSRCADQAAACNALLREIVQLEKTGLEQMTDRRNEITERLQQMHVAGEVRSAYQAQQ